jgi:CRP-like cAMP-binding protein
MPDFLEEKKREIDARLKELRPLVDEYQRLEAAAAALQGVGGATNSRSSAPATRRTRRRSASSASSSSSGGTRTRTGTGRRGRPRGSGTRSKQALELVRSRPGITIPEIAESIGIQQNYLYRVLPSLQKDGLVRKEGRGWHPREAA